MQRLKTRPQFQATMSGGVVSRTAHFALHRLQLEAGQTLKDTSLPGPGGLPSGQTPPALFVVPGCTEPQCWLGTLVPKRWAKRSVTRHAIKRQVYAVSTEFSAQLQALPPAAYVVRLRAGFDRQQFVSATSEVLKQAVRAELLQLFGYAVRRKPAASRPAAVMPAAETSAATPQVEAAPATVGVG